MTRRILSRFVAAGASLLLYGACGGDSGDPVQPPALTPTTITPVPPVPESCTLGVPTELRAKVTDANGAAVSGALVTFTVGTGAGTVSPPTSVTDAAGVAATSFTCAPPVGPTNNTAQARFDGLQQSPAVWSLNASAGALAMVDFLAARTPDSIPVLAGSTQPVALAGLLRDRFGASPAVTVTWEVLTGGGSLASGSTPARRCPSEVRNSELIDAWCVSNSWTLGSSEPGVQTIRLSSPDSPDFEQRFHVRVVPGPLMITQEPHPHSREWPGLSSRRHSRCGFSRRTGRRFRAWCFTSSGMAIPSR